MNHYENESGINKAYLDKLVEKILTLPFSMQFAVHHVLPNIPNGAFWGFVPLKEVSKYALELEKDKNLTFRKIGTGEYCLLSINPDYLIRILYSADPAIIDQDFYKNIQRHTLEAMTGFVKCLYTKGLARYSGYLGIYSLNNVQTISYKSKTYPAFRITLEQAFAKLKNWGYQVKMSSGYQPIDIALEDIPLLLKNMEISPTLTGIFLSVKSTLTEAELKRLYASAVKDKRSISAG